MSTAHPVHWFEIPVQDLARARKFYESVFDVNLEHHEMEPFTMAVFPMQAGEPGAAGALVQGPGYQSSQVGSLVYFSVDDIDQSLARIKAAGGAELMPNTDLGEHGFCAHFGDSEGNRVALHSMGK